MLYFKCFEKPTHRICRVVINGELPRVRVQTSNPICQSGLVWKAFGRTQMASLASAGLPAGKNGFLYCLKVCKAIVAFKTQKKVCFPNDRYQGATF